MAIDFSQEGGYVYFESGDGSQRHYFVCLAKNKKHSIKKLWCEDIGGCESEEENEIILDHDFEFMEDVGGPNIQVHLQKIGLVFFNSKFLM